MADDLVDLDQAARAFYELSKRLKAAEKGRRAAFHKSIREAAKPLIPAVRAQAAARFPTHGGLNRHMSKGSRYRTVAKTGVTTAGVSIRANRTDPRMDTEGRIVHPVPIPGSGHTVSKTSVKTRKTTTRKAGGKFLVNDAGKRRMIVQYFPAAVGFFSGTIEEHADEVRAEVVARLERWAIENLSGTIHG